MAWNSYRMHWFLRNIITRPFILTTVEISIGMGKYIILFYVDGVIYPCSFDSNLAHLFQ